MMSFDDRTNHSGNITGYGELYEECSIGLFVMVAFE